MSFTFRDAPHLEPRLSRPDCSASSPVVPAGQPSVRCIAVSRSQDAGRPSLRVLLKAAPLLELLRKSLLSPSDIFVV